MGLNYRTNPVEIHIATTANHVFSFAIYLTLALLYTLFVDFRFGGILMLKAYVIKCAIRALVVQ